MPARPMVFRPMLETRIACSVPGLMLAGFVGDGALRQADAVLLALAGPVVILGVVLAVRAYRMAVIVDGRTVTVRGMCLSRTVPRSGVDALHDGDTRLLFVFSPTISWHDEAGTAKRTSLWMFGNPVQQIADVAGHNQRTLRELRRRLGISATGDRRLRR
ncbi:hypothetical protein KZZ52_31805 [Dactylosporangium sp. AC04546]|uniref:hypothetical protein n=1 Tax=Dactylosporangium sp. AC04546 TaxID=2862460 RepID=UPI001EDD567D|nr:hypothetical protein [Dactylosporangium sp. AC04546]WVK78577.1 hypothetical protein KZZ52_31805 [Dactylosporangium sp. AC04546]